jgi:CRISPR/Cas system-associated exonuclease Cas4 (RecB family)
MAESGPWVSATDLADYTFCPRSHYYREHPPAGAPTRFAEARSSAGERYHRRVLGAERRREEHAGAYWVALAIGMLLVVGGIAWIFLR